MDELIDITLLSQFCLSPSISLAPGSNLTHNLSVTLNTFRTGVVHFGSCVCLWALIETALCICREENQTAHNTVCQCEALQPLNSIDDLVSPSPDGVCCLDRLVGMA